MKRVSISLQQFNSFKASCCRFPLTPLCDLQTTELIERLSESLTAWKLQNISGRQCSNHVGNHSQTSHNFEVSRYRIGRRRFLL